MTLAHELGHGVMHAAEGLVDNRVTGVGGTTELSKARASESAEHQAKVFASAFLIDDERALELEFSRGYIYGVSRKLRGRRNLL